MSLPLEDTPEETLSISATQLRRFTTNFIETEVRLADITKITRFGEYQNRRDGDEPNKNVESQTSIVAMCASLNDGGALPPVWLTTHKASGKYAVLDGAHRIAAYRKFNPAETMMIPALIVAGSRQMLKRIAYASNLLNGVEQPSEDRARLAVEYLGTYDKAARPTLKSVAELFRLDSQTLANYITQQETLTALENLGMPITGKVESRAVALGKFHAEHLIAMRPLIEQLAAANRNSRDQSLLQDKQLKALEQSLTKEAPSAQLSVVQAFVKEFSKTPRKQRGPKPIDPANAANNLGKFREDLQKAPVAVCAHPKTRRELREIWLLLPSDMRTEIQAD